MKPIEADVMKFLSYFATFLAGMLIGGILLASQHAPTPPSINIGRGAGSEAEGNRTYVHGLPSIGGGSFVHGVVFTTEGGSPVRGYTVDAGQNGVAVVPVQ